MRYLRQSNNERVLVPDAAALGVGGEARVYAVPPDNRFAAKIYHHPAESQARKLTAMLANPPDDPMAAQEHISIAWPVDLLRKMYGDQGFAGFLMPRVSGMRPLFNVYNPVTRRQECPLFNTLYLHRAARNVTAAVRALHSRGYVIGDVNESNILVTETALVTLVDTDSFQVRDPQSGQMYRCPVGKPEFTPPELQGKNFRLVDRSPESDRFGLAVLLFQLLMEGAHPFSGVYQGEDDPPPYETRIREGHFTYGAKAVPYQPMPLAPPYAMLHPDLRALFSRCFEEGHARPDLRPDATIWLNALVRAEDALVTCARNPQHRYGDHLDACPWCARTDLLGGRDPFPLHAAQPYVRPGRDERKVERTVYNQAGSGVTLAASGASSTITLTRSVAAPSSPHTAQPAANLPNWPLAPTAAYAPAGIHPLFNLPNYPNATWTAAIFSGLALMVPGFHLLFGVLAVLSGLIGWQASHEGRKVALVSGAAGALTSLAILANVAYRAYVPAELRSIEEKGPVRSVTFSPNSAIVAAATERNEDQRLISGEAALFDTQTGTVNRTFIFKGDVASVAFSPDGKLFGI